MPLFCCNMATMRKPTKLPNVRPDEPPSLSLSALNFAAAVVIALLAVALQLGLLDGVLRRVFA